MNYSFVATASDWSTAYRSLFTADGCENAGAFLCGLAKTEYGGRLLAREFIAVPADLYQDRQSYHLEVAPRFYNDVVTRCARSGLNPVIIHSHPTDGAAWYSPSDDFGENRLLAVLKSLLPESVVGSLVVTRESAIGRRLNREKFVPLKGMRIVGSFITSTSFTELPPANHVESKYDRQVRAFGEARQRLLGELKVGIVGLGGTGSLVAEQVARVGLGQIVLIDDDVIDDTNLSRVVGATVGDVGKPKVAVAGRHLAAITSAKLEQINDSALRQPVLMKLRDCDAVLGCVDNDRTRAALNRFAYQYLVPVIDMGVRIDARTGLVSAAAGRVSVVGPDLTCLRCSHHLNSARILAESLPPTERERLAKEGYVMGLEERAPAVISLNAVVAGLAVTALLNLFTGLTGGHQATDQIYDATSGSVFPVAPRHEVGCDICDQDVGVKALGDGQLVSAY